MPKIYDERYREIKERSTITTIQRAEFDDLLKLVKHKQQKQAMALAILIYYTGARPAEVLELTGKDIKKRGRHLLVFLTGKKSSNPRELRLLMSNKHIKFLWGYCEKLFPDQYLYWAFRSKKKRTIKYRLHSGLLIQKDFVDLSSNVWYWFKKWFNITPYFFRHNRFSLAGDMGASSGQIKFLKGAKTIKSTEIYVTLSGQKAKQTSKYLN